MTYKHILLTTDFSEGSEAVYEKAISLAKQMKARLSFLHVVEPLPGYGYGFVGSAEMELQLIEEAKKALALLGKKYHIPSKDQYVEVGPTKVEIHRLAEKYGVDLIVVGSHGRHGLSYLLGSTANAVIHGASCDVLTIRIKGKE
jgi:universal stress protein A